MTDEKPTPKPRSKARKAPAVQSSVLAAALQDAMSGSFLNSGSDSTAALLAQMTGGGNGGNSSAPTGGSVPPFKTAAPIVPAPTPAPAPMKAPAPAPAATEPVVAATPTSPPAPEPEPVHATAAPAAEETQAVAPAPTSVQTSAPLPEPAPQPVPAVAPAPEPQPEPQSKSQPQPQRESELEVQPEPARAKDPAEPAPVVERSPRALESEPVSAPAPSVHAAPAKVAAPPRPPRRTAPAPVDPAPVVAAPVAPAIVEDDETRTAHESLLESFLDARINSKGWETWGFRLLPDVKSRLGRRLTADKRSSQNRRLALGHYLNAALLELPEDNEEQIEMIRSFLRARGGITDPSQSSSYRVSPAVYELARDLDTELTATEKRGLVVYLFSAAVELFLDRLDAEGALARPDLFTPQQ
jgi:hypothetical protein